MKVGYVALCETVQNDFAIAQPGRRKVPYKRFTDKLQQWFDKKL
jgi:hypothetical protein